MEDLAQKLCEAVENEDAKEVENLLKCGADPNFVLPNGIAAIHLASGKESECALRCLKLLLQHSGNPNVRSIDDLTPVHVASSWGCCKALIFLLQKGGDPFIQDQDGNTALDLALMENNRRCVVALQEYTERISDGYTGEMDGCHKNSTSLPDITEMSCITLLLGSTYENTPSSSTKISPLMSLPKTVTPGNMDYAVISSHLEMPGLCRKNDSNKELQIDDSTKIMQNKCEIKPTEAKEVVAFTKTSESSHCSEYFSTHGESVVTLENSSICKNINCDVSVKTQHLIDHDNSRAALGSHMYSTVPQDLASSRKLPLNPSTQDFQVFTKLDRLDEISLDHVNAYNKECIDDNEEDTLILHGNGSDFRNKHSECNTSIWDSGDRRWRPERILNSFHNSVNDTMNAQNLELVGMQKGVPSVENKELTDVSIPSERSRAPTEEGTEKTVRTSDMLQKTQSPTLTCVAPNYLEHGSHNLQTQLRNLLLSTKGCNSRQRSEVVSADTIPVNGETNSLQHGSLKQTDACSSSSSSEDTFIIEAHKYELHDKEDSELYNGLKEMLAAKHSPSTSNEDKSPFFTPRTKSRLHCYNFRHNISSLFEESVEMPKRGRRVRKPEDPLATFSHDLTPDEFLPRKSSHSPGVTDESTKTSDTSETLNIIDAKNSLERTSIKNIVQDDKENDSELQTTVDISNFLTDDLSSEAEVKSRELKQTAGNHCVEGGVLDSAWLTEDGESEISGVADQRNRDVIMTWEDKSLPASLVNQSFYHSTFIEDTAVNSSKVPRYSFSRLSSIVKVEESIAQLDLSTVEEVQEVPLSPGGRPVYVGQAEPVEYLYKDNDKGHVLIEKHMPSMDQSSTNLPGNSDNTIIYDWRNYKINTITMNKAPPSNSPNRVAVELYRLSNDEIASRLRGFGDEPVHVTSQNRKMCILLLDKRLKELTSNRPSGLSIEYSAELSLALHTCNIPDCSKDEAALSQEFDKPDKTQKWREGVLKSSFNYLLLDPRVTRNLPSRCHDLSPVDCFLTFVSAVFYVGKGKRSRPYCHLYEALNLFKGSCKQPCSKVKHIMDIWKSGQGVLSLHCFQNTIPVEAYTREACMVDAIGLKLLTNQKKGVYYGQCQGWAPTRRRRLGVHMLYKAMQIFLAEGERQLRPPDIRSGY
ncbi:ankyrin repeat and LEM domain-containing protein 1 isoform X1 [Ranitomeya imitator]|uniref:ankyrin repeat and LEM domain-containing protein 1 isoform X1 n=1 Tax=Ranitomeya imitator TaxID=111125 RepID=UPI0037E6FB2B